MKNNILITGGAGNIGGSLARRLVKNTENNIVIVDNFLTGTKEKFPDASNSNWMFVNADVNNFSDISSVMTSNQFDYVYHYAAVVGVERTLKNPILVLDDISGIRNILDLSKNTGVKRILFSSSSEVYGEPVEIPQFEHTTPLNSRLPYAIVKNVAESFCKSYQQEYGLDYTIFRFFNTYGPLQSNDFVISKFVAQALRNEDITIYGNGEQTRTFCYIDDNLDVTEDVVKNDLWVNDVANVGSDVEISIRDLAQIIIDVTGSSSNIIHLPPLEEGDMTRRKPDITKMKEVLGRDLTCLEDGILKLEKFYRKTYS